MNLLSALSMLGREAGRMVLPSPCVVCQEELPWVSRRASCCERCWENLPEIVEPKCRFCAAVWLTTSAQESFVCGRCIEAPLKLAWLDAWGHYSAGLERVLGAFKFGRHQFLADPLSALLMETLTGRDDRSFDCVVPVPMHPRKERERGFNQAELLAHELAKRTPYPLRRDLLRKTELRRPQSSLAKAERAANVRGAFTASEGSKGASVLLIDDICTTGETLNACAAALLKKGAERVCAVVVARA